MTQFPRYARIAAILCIFLATPLSVSGESIYDDIEMASLLKEELGFEAARVSALPMRGWINALDLSLFSLKASEIQKVAISAGDLFLRKYPETTVVTIKLSGVVDTLPHRIWPPSYHSVSYDYARNGTVSRSSLRTGAH